MLHFLLLTYIFNAKYLSRYHTADSNWTEPHDNFYHFHNNLKYSLEEVYYHLSLTAYGAKKTSKKHTKEYQAQSISARSKNVLYYYI